MAKQMANMQITYLTAYVPWHCVLFYRKVIENLWGGVGLIISITNFFTYDTISPMNASKLIHDGFVNPSKVARIFDLKEGMKFADFGSGSGAYVLEGAKLVGNTGKVYAIDIQKDLLIRLKQQAFLHGYDNITFLWCDFENEGATELPRDSIDVVLMSNVLFQLYNKKGAFVEARRILKDKEGRLFVIDWYESFKGMGPDEKLIVSKDNAIDLAISAGFNLVDEFAPGAHHYGLIFAKA